MGHFQRQLQKGSNSAGTDKEQPTEGQKVPSRLEDSQPCFRLRSRYQLFQSKSRSTIQRGKFKDNKLLEDAYYNVLGLNESS